MVNRGHHGNSDQSFALKPHIVYCVFCHLSIVASFNFFNNLKYSSSSLLLDRVGLLFVPRDPQDPQSPMTLTPVQLLIGTNHHKTWHFRDTVTQASRHHYLALVKFTQIFIFLLPTREIQELTVHLLPTVHPLTGAIVKQSIKFTVLSVLCVIYVCVQIL